MPETAEDKKSISELEDEAERGLLEQVIYHSIEGMQPTDALTIAANAYRAFREGKATQR